MATLSSLPLELIALILHECPQQVTLNLSRAHIKFAEASKWLAPITIRDMLDEFFLNGTVRILHHSYWPDDRQAMVRVLESFQHYKISETYNERKFLSRQEFGELAAAAAVCFTFSNPISFNPGDYDEMYPWFDRVKSMAAKEAKGPLKNEFYWLKHGSYEFYWHILGSTSESVNLDIAARYENILVAIKVLSRTDLCLDLSGLFESHSTFTLRLLFYPLDQGDNQTNLRSSSSLLSQDQSLENVIFDAMLADKLSLESDHNNIICWTLLAGSRKGEEDLQKILLHLNRNSSSFNCILLSLAIRKENRRLFKLLSRDSRVGSFITNRNVLDALGDCNCTEILKYFLSHPDFDVTVHAELLSCRLVLRNCPKTLQLLLNDIQGLIQIVEVLLAHPRFHVPVGAGDFARKAAYNGKLTVLKVLLNDSMIRSDFDPNNFRMIADIVERNHKHILEYLDQEHNAPALDSLQSKSLLFSALYYDTDATFQYLLHRFDFDPSIEDQAIFSRAVQDGAVKCVEYLLQHARVDPSFGDTSVFQNIYDTVYGYPGYSGFRLQPDELEHNHLIKHLKKGKYSHKLDAIKIGRRLLKDPRVKKKLEDTFPGQDCSFSETAFDEAFFDLEKWVHLYEWNMDNLSLYYDSEDDD